jgi:hypothetical protein
MSEKCYFVQVVLLSFGIDELTILGKLCRFGFVLSKVAEALDVEFVIDRPLFRPHQDLHFRAQAIFGHLGASRTCQHDFQHASFSEL